jgi:hypothetical protein
MCSTFLLIGSSAENYIRRHRAPRKWFEKKRTVRKNLYSLVEQDLEKNKAKTKGKMMK